MDEGEHAVVLRVEVGDMATEFGTEAVVSVETHRGEDISIPLVDTHPNGNVHIRITPHRRGEGLRRMGRIVGTRANQLVVDGVDGPDATRRNDKNGRVLLRI